MPGDMGSCRWPLNEVIELTAGVSNRTHIHAADN